MKIFAHVIGAVFLFALIWPCAAWASAGFSAPTAISANWSGYVAANGAFSGIGASWTIPKVSESKRIKTDAAWVGIGGVSSHDLIQAGTEGTTGVGGKTVYQAWYELLPNYAQPVPLAVHENDLISVEISAGARGSWQILISNNSTGQKFAKTVAYKSSQSSAEWIEEMPSDGVGLIPLDNFGRVQFSSGWAVLDGKRVSIAETGAKTVAIANKQGKVLAAPSKLDKSGSSFAVARSKFAAGSLMPRPFVFASETLIPQLAEYITHQILKPVL